MSSMSKSMVAMYCIQTFHINPSVRTSHWGSQMVVVRSHGIYSLFLLLLPAAAGSQGRSSQRSPMVIGLPLFFTTFSIFSSLKPSCRKYFSSAAISSS